MPIWGVNYIEMVKNSIVLREFFAEAYRDILMLMLNSTLKRTES